MKHTELSTLIKNKDVERANLENDIAKAMAEFDERRNRINAQELFSRDMAEKLDITLDALTAELKKIGLMLDVEKFVMYGNYVTVFLYPTKENGFVPVPCKGYDSKGKARNEKSRLAKADKVGKVFHKLGFIPNVNSYSVEHGAQSTFSCVIVELNLKAV